MSAFGAMDRGTRVAIVLLGGVAAAGVGYLGWQMSRPVPQVEAAQETAAASVEPAAVAAIPEPQTDDSADPETAAAPAADTPTADTDQASDISAAPDVAEDQAANATTAPAVDPATPTLPVIDTWRVTSEGEAVVSGSATPGATIDVVVDDATVATGEVTASGDFAILFNLPPNAKPSLMWLSMNQPGQTAVASAEMVALGPIEGPKLAAQTDAPTATGLEVAAVEEPAAPPALLLSDEGAVVLQDPTAPERSAGPNASVMIDTISYTPDGEVQVGGRGAGGAALRIYLDNAEKVTISVADSGKWLTTLPDTPPGVYSLRVDQLDANGKVTSRFETPFKRETLEALAAVVGSEPEQPPAQDTATAMTEAPAQPPVANSVPDVAAATEPPEATVADVAATEPAPTETESAETSSTEAATPETTATETATVSPDAPAATQADPATATAVAAPVTVTVQPGFTLWGIAQERYGDGVFYVQVFEANRETIKNPDLIYPGQVFSVPETIASP